MEFFNTSKGPAAVGPYSTGVKLPGGLVLLSGQIPLDPATGILSGQTASEQSKTVLSNISLILSEQGLKITDIARVVIYTTRLSEFTAINEVYAAFFGAHKPVRTTVEVTALPKGALVEMEVTACRP